MKRIVYLDGWRGLAVLSVLEGHFVGVQTLELGRFGVELFFVLSGRLMAEILFVRTAPLPSFFWRRFSRVYPALLVLALAMLATAGWRRDAYGGPDVLQFLSAITFTQNYADLVLGRVQVLDHIWSLCIEEHMYLLLGLIAFVHRRRALPLVPILTVMIVLMMISGLLQTLAGGDYYTVYWRTDVRGASLLVGVLAYLVWHKQPPVWLSWSYAPVLLGALSLALTFHGVPDPVKYSVGAAALAGALILMPQAPVWVRRALEYPGLVQVGIWSYSLYLWQQPFEAMGGHFPARMLHLAMAIPCALLSFYVVEQPMRRYLNGLAGRRPPVPPAAEQPAA